MPIRTPNDILICFEEEKAKQFIEKVWGLNLTFICVIGNTETAKIPRISAAGKYPELTDYTPAADVELLFYGRYKCIKGVPSPPKEYQLRINYNVSSTGCRYTSICCKCRCQS